MRHRAIARAINNAGKIRPMKTRTVVAVACLALLGASSHAAAQAPEKASGWQFTVGAGGIYAPSYLGDDEYRLRVVPNISIKYEDRFFASIGGGVGYNVINSDNWRAGPIAKYDFGREEDGSSTFAVTGDDTNDLIGLGDVDGTVEAGGFVKYTRNAWTGSLELRQGIGGHEGLIGEVGISYRGQLKLGQRPAMFSVGPKLVFASDDYNSAFFDVNAGQSARSGLAAYDAEAGLVSYGLQGSFVVPISDSVRFVTFGSINQLGSEIADSSLVSTRGSDVQGTLGVLLNYTF